MAPYNVKAVAEAEEERRPGHVLTTGFRRHPRQFPYAVWIQTACSDKYGQTPYLPLLHILQQLQPPERGLDAATAISILAKVPKYLVPGIGDLAKDVLEALAVLAGKKPRAALRAKDRRCPSN